jgi:hypothetical protein
VFIHYTRDLKFDDRPDYGFLKKLIKTTAEREKIEFDYQFDWVKKQDEKKDDESEESKKIREAMQVDSGDNFQLNKAKLNEFPSNENKEKHTK